MCPIVCGEECWRAGLDLYYVYYVYFAYPVLHSILPVKKGSLNPCCYSRRAVHTEGPHRPKRQPVMSITPRAALDLNDPRALD